MVKGMERKGIERNVLGDGMAAGNRNRRDWGLENGFYVSGLGS